VRSTGGKIFAEITELEHEISSKEDQRNSLYDRTIREASGVATSGNTGLPGKGPVFSSLIAELHRTDYELEDLRSKNEAAIIQYRKRLDELHSRTSSLLESRSDTSGFLARIAALKQLCAENGAARLLTWLLVLIIAQVNVLPGLIQLFSKPGLYEYCADKMAQRVREQYARGVDDTVSAQELEEKLEEVTNLVRFKSRVA
jgi:hypothetical protein